MVGDKRVLFVCGGNTCRSPMAVGFAQKIAKGVFDSESRGIYPCGNSASDYAIAVMRSEFDIDISSHQPLGLVFLSILSG